MTAVGAPSAGSPGRAGGPAPAARRSALEYRDARATAARAACAWSIADARLLSTTTGLSVCASNRLHRLRVRLVAVVLLAPGRPPARPRRRRRRRPARACSRRSSVLGVRCRCPRRRAGSSAPARVEQLGQPVDGRRPPGRRTGRRPLGHVGDERPLATGVVHGGDAGRPAAAHPPADGEQLEACRSARRGRRPGARRTPRTAPPRRASPPASAPECASTISRPVADPPTVSATTGMSRSAASASPARRPAASRSVSRNSPTTRVSVEDERVPRGSRTRGRRELLPGRDGEAVLQPRGACAASPRTPSPSG